MCHTREERRQCAAIAIQVLCVGKADGERLLLGGAAAVAFGYDRPAHQRRQALSLGASATEAECEVAERQRRAEAEGRGWAEAGGG